jgi:nucleolar protein 14
MTRMENRRTDSTMNPFEVRVNKRKHAVLGRTLKSERGIRSQARSKALQKRKKTLLLEYQRRKKTGLFFDKRLGENDKRMSVEEKMFHRFTTERRRQHKQRRVDFNLEEPEDFETSLSTKGTSRYQVEIDDFRLTEDDVKQAHFGGFEDDGDPVLHRPQMKIMEDVITRSKKAKFERQTAKDSLADLTEKLDSEWASIRTTTLHGGAKLCTDHVIDDYDLSVKQLSLESRARVSQHMYL